MSHRRINSFHVSNSHEVWYLYSQLLSVNLTFGIIEAWILLKRNKKGSGFLVRIILIFFSFFNLAMGFVAYYLSNSEIEINEQWNVINYELSN